MENGKKRVLLAVAALAVLGAAGYAFFTRNLQSTDDAQIESHVVTVAARVAGYARDVLVDNNQAVKAGDVLVRIDPADYKIALDRASADLKSAEAKLDAAKHGYTTVGVYASSNVASAEAQVDAAEAQWARDRSELARLQKLTDAARSRSQLDAAVAAEKTSKAALAKAQESLKFAQTAPETVSSVESFVRSMEAAVEKAKADVLLAEKNLADTEIKAPFDGTVAGKSLESGAYLAPGTPLMFVVGLDDWVVANFKETQLEKMHPGQSAEVELDAYPGRKLKAHVDSIEPGTGARFSLFPPENATGNFVKVVQRVPVKIVFDEKPDPALHLGPGMSVEPTVDTASAAK